MTAGTVHPAVRAVTNALVSSELAFTFSPFYAEIPHSTVWSLDFEHGPQVVLWVEEDGKRVVLATLLEDPVPHKTNSTRFWIEPAEPFGDALLTQLAVSKVGSRLEHEIYELLDELRTLTRETKRTASTRRARTKKKAKAGAKKKKSAPK